MAIALSRPTIKRLWHCLAKAKLRAQADAVAAIGKESKEIRALVRRLRVGTVATVEREADNLYWTALFGPAFCRNRSCNGANGRLNYAEAVLWRSMSKAIEAVGVEPSMSLNLSRTHCLMQLVDDLSVPFLPTFHLVGWAASEMPATSARYRTLVQGTLGDVMYTCAGEAPVADCIHQLAESMSGVLNGSASSLIVPLSTLSLDTHVQATAVAYSATRRRAQRDSPVLA